MRAIATALLTACASLAAAADYAVDTSHSALIWGIQHLGLGNTYGTINDFSGNLSWDKANPAAGSVSLTAQVASIDSNNKKRDDHLRAADIFDAANHPTITFTGTGFTPVAGQTDTFTVAGQLTIRGTTRPVTVTFRKVGEGPQPMMNNKAAVGFEGEFTINRRDFGVGTGKVDGAMGNAVRIIVSLEAVAP
jgi:polyisoprenoid-binding protein YceI